MNTFRFSVVAVVALVAAAGLAVGPRAAGAEQLAAAAQAAKPDPMQIARGAKAWSENCGRCHNLRSPKEFTDKDWSVIVDHMRVIAPLPGAMARDIKAFLMESN